MLHIENVTFSYNHTQILTNVNLRIQQSEILCLLGASGSGKSTLLRVIAGLEQDYQGDIRLDDTSIKAIPVHQRDFGLMFQDFALFPHKNVAENVAFGLRMKSLSIQERQQRVASVLALVGLHEFHQRDVSELSGGEKQRVALARSLAPQPRLLMLDEPLGSLDAGLRERLVTELRDIMKQVGLTALYVTHDQQEAYAVADRIAIMYAGHIEQVDTPQDLYRQPASAYTARFLGLHNVISPAAFSGLFADTAAPAILLHPDGISLADDGQIQGQVLERVFRGAAYRLTVRASDETLVFYTPANHTVPTVGAWVKLDVRPDAVIPIES